MDITFEDIEKGATYGLMFVGSLVMVTRPFMALAHLVDRFAKGTQAKWDNKPAAAFVWVAESLHGCTLKVQTLLQRIVGGAR